MVLILVAAGGRLAATGEVGIYAILTRVVMEPNETAPERIQLWGVFTLGEGVSAA